MEPYQQNAVDQLKKGGVQPVAQVWALLAIASAIEDLAEAIRDLKKDFISIEVIDR